MCFGREVFEEVVQPIKMFVTIPKQLLLRWCEFIVGTVNGKIKLDPIFQ